MIYDRLDRLDQYSDCLYNLDKVLEFIKTHDLSALPKGRNEIDGENVFVNIVDTNTIPFEEGVFEYHKQYLDLHIDIVGEEYVVYTELNANNVFITSEYKEEGDYSLMKGPECYRCKVDREHLTICFPDEPHMPCVLTTKEGMIRKAIFKIRVN